MTVHCSTTMVSLAGGEVLRSSYTNKPSKDLGTGSPETQKLPVICANVFLWCHISNTMINKPAPADLLT